MRARTTPMSSGESSLDRWETRLKLVGLLGLVFAFAGVSDVRLLPVMVLTALAIYRLSSLPSRYLLTRLKVPGVFLIALAVVLPLFSGETVIASLGPIALRLEGVIAFVSVAARFFSIITVATVLFGTTPMPTLVRAMGALGLPSLLSDMLLFTYRYIFQLADDLRRARTAARLRGAGLSSIRSIPTTANIVGSLLVRSNWQAERVLAAMTLRGYGSPHSEVARQAPRAADIAAFAACITLAGVFVVSQAVLL